jgi:tetratricopeptide (TPR) repeat protein
LQARVIIFCLVVRTSTWITTLALLVNAAAQVPSPESDQEFARGVQLQQAGDLAGACRAYEAALKLSPGRVDALSNLGLAYGGMGRYDRATQAFEKALAIVPNQPAVLFNLGLTYLQSEQNEKARRTLAAAADAPHGNYLARHYLGVALLKLNRGPEGIAELEKVASSHAEDVEALDTLASAYVRYLQLEKAHDLIERVISRQDTAEGHLIIGSYYLAAKDYRAALVELRRAQELNPALPGLGTSLGGVYAMTGGRDAAVEFYSEALKKDPDDFDILAVLGWLHLEADQMEQADKLLRRAHHIRPNDVEVMFQLARIARSQENFTEAATLLERVIADKPDHARAHVLLAQTYFRLKRTADGKRERDIAQRLNDEEQAKRNAEIENARPGRH